MGFFWFLCKQFFYHPTFLLEMPNYLDSSCLLSSNPCLLHEKCNHISYLDQVTSLDSRISWISQLSWFPAIFGAMNQGFLNAASTDWLLFWGSDDWAASPNVFSEAVAALSRSVQLPDLLVCSGRYVSEASGELGRSTVFHKPCLLNQSVYRKTLFLGATPPHQATFLGPGARKYLSNYSSGFRLSADLDYFLKLSDFQHLRVQCLDLELVHMFDGGISGQQTNRRLKEVILAYSRSFGRFWLIPFVARYLRRLRSLMTILK